MSFFITGPEETEIMNCKIVVVQYVSLYFSLNIQSLSILTNLLLLVLPFSTGTQFTKSNHRLIQKSLELEQMKHTDLYI